MTRPAPRRAALAAPLPQSFYEQPVLQVARDLIGCTVRHQGVAGVIVETEAYHHSEPACHAFVGLTPRTQTLFGPPGRAYVYRSYGIHALLNAVCEPAGVGAAVLIRALLPTAGIGQMRRRRRGIERELELCSGPGKLTQALGVELAHNDTSLQGGPITIHPRLDDRCTNGARAQILTGPRIGISKAAELPWRFCLAGSPHVSRPRPR